MNDVGARAPAATDRLRALARSPRALAAGGALLLVLLIARACGGGDEVVYETEAVRRGELVVTVTATGTLQPINQVDIGSELSGIMRSVEVDFNDPVRKGQALARLDTARLEAQVLQSRAALAAANARIEQAKASELEAGAQLARLEHVREISGGKVPSVAELDTARATSARAHAEVANANAAAAQARATLETQRTDLGKAVIRSPIDGVVLKRAIEPGQTVAASLQAPILFTLAEDLDHMELLVSVDEADVSAVADGQRASFSVDAWPGRAFAAEVVQVRYGADALEGVVTYGALLRVENPERRLRPGMTATAEITVNRIADALLVPNAALRFAPPDAEAAQSGGLLRALLPGRPWGRRERETRERGAKDQNVYRLRDGELERVALTAGATNGDFTEVAAGELAVDDALVVDALASSVSAPLAELAGVEKVYGAGETAVHALRGIDLRIAAGEFVALMGPSGSGKSTCMNLLGCLDTPSAGHYRFEGIDVGSLSRDERALLRRRAIGFVFQGFNLLGRTSALENVELPLVYRGAPREERRALAERALASVGLTGWEGHTPAQLSGGQQQRVAIARAIVTTPPLLLADEPTGNLDSARAREIMELIANLNRERGIAVVVVTHDAEVARWASRIVQFFDGLIPAPAFAAGGS